MTVPPVSEEELMRELNTGALSHPLLPFTVTRLALCLLAVLHATGVPGAIAFRQFCADRDRQDRSKTGR